LKNGECKSTCIAHPDALFVDDSFSERAQVHHALGVTTFDCSMIEVLLASEATSLSFEPVSLAGARKDECSTDLAP
jgi:hypothetical protein